MQVVFRSEDFRADQRFEAWRELSRRVPAPLEVRSDHEDDFRATLRVLDLGAVYVTSASVSSLRAHRTLRMIRRSDPKYYQLELVVDGKIRVRQEDREALVRSGELVFHNTSRPLTAWSEEGVMGIALWMPRTLLPLPAPQADRLIARPLPGRDGIGSLLAGLLTRLNTGAHDYRPADATRIGTILADLVAALLAHELEAEPTVLPESRERTLLLRIHAFIQQHLQDPDLAPEMIAAAHHISIRHLYRLFAQQERPVVGWIRHQRLERARRDLADPAERAVPIHAIAARWGFAHPADFSRAFRTAYGTAPRNWRHQAADAGGTERQESGQAQPTTDRRETASMVHEHTET
ncbi:helix-turn-helix domain-containing protein [Nocardia sp. 2YAB30]|uniref:AraC-like ligand-binding domain-containing protein n=1 Tax=Nocardia sp. 2YAB30 TaxID=3233022 RepID=UPI003F96CCC9